MTRMKQLARQAPVRQALADLAARENELIELAVAIQQIPAPTFSEARRAMFVEETMRKIPLEDVARDPLNNVYGRLAGAGTATPVIISAHLDTVFGPDIDLTVHRRDGLVYGPGIGDNCTGLAGMLQLADLLRRGNWSLPADVWFVANVCEEGLGDLKGMRALAERFGGEARYIVVEGGVLGTIYHAGIGVSRYRITVDAPGGHSWGAFGSPSAVHAIGRLIAAIADMQMPKSPRTTYNVGVVEGGSTVNTIAQQASLLLDLRSEDAEALAGLEEKVSALVDAARRPDGIEIRMEQVGNRPAGGIRRDAPLVALASDALATAGWQDIVFEAGSTDANIPLSQGWEAVCIGLTRSGNAHRLDEFMDPRFLTVGMAQLLMLTLAAAGR